MTGGSTAVSVAVGYAATRYLSRPLVPFDS